MKKILFIGHSVLAFYSKEQIDQWQIVNRAKQGTIAKDGWKLIEEEEILINEFEAVFIMYGINEVYYQFNERLVTDYLEKIVRKVRDSSGHLPLIIAPIMKTWPTKRLQPLKIQKINQKIIELARDYDCVLFNWEEFYDLKDEADKKYSMDGIHLNSAGYLLFERGLSRILANLYN
ncbi:SGNH/GDSL hydrolase family protein [Facklamia sp. DSM 111018]|uniref:SGNH/GDSL hydrolase family protein n=1 Tax=Facklamia lactis TaxID=2749967 RepID=A0ABS0LPH6_9LACT|nr:SGNH/GDSL hydrolase family protein [Facklamia lactis]MBG9986050.1 SGNH/GDSL hydrolase family protein [Facklamia lactis]